jgi:hypothetical protein
MPHNRSIDGDPHFRRGMNSINPLDLVEGFYLRSFNMVNRGGLLQTRPGYRWVETLPDGVPQGITIFTPRNSLPEMIVVIGGAVYRSLFPYDEFTQLTDIELSPFATQVYFAHCTKTVTRNEDNSLSFTTPVNVLIIQDGASAPAYYDGHYAGHRTGELTTPVGTVMAWTGDRLWVASKNKIFVSDIEDPYSFYESVYNALGGKRYFSIEGEITAMAETPGSQPQLLVFTSTRTEAFKSYIRDRDSWPDVAEFQRPIFPSLGCVANRSLFAQHGLLWWLSAYGLVSLDSALLSEQTSELDFQDNEMSWSKAQLNTDLSGAAGVRIFTTPTPGSWILQFEIR